VATDVRDVLASVRSLLGGGAAFIIGNSLLGIVLPLRMEGAGYPVGLIGIIMTAYYAGLALGSVFGKQVILRVGHIRAFAVFAAVAAATALAYPLAFVAAPWLILRLVNGFCIAGLTATIESWLNERSSNRTRGRVLGLYMVTYYLAVASGQLLVNVAEVTGPALFMLAAGLIGLSLVPVALTRLGAPALDGHRSLSIRELHAASPVGAVGAGVAGVAGRLVLRLGRRLRAQDRVEHLGSLTVHEHGGAGRLQLPVAHRHPRRPS
jgi:MFS family permease